jgi:hypothetical protein
MSRLALLVMTAVLGLTACAAWRADTYTLAPAVKESAHRYSDVMDDFADQALLANVLRARDYAPLNFNDLSSITGSLSLSGTMAFTLPFGPFLGYRPYPSSQLGSSKNTFSPSLTSSTSPLINIGTLNTQGFMMTMIQPISTTYILSKWDSYPHELLLSLFIKSIRFPGEEDNPTDSSKRRSHRNDPDSEEAFRDFQRLAAEMLATKDVRVGDRTVHVGNVDMKSLMILDPLGNPVPMGKTLTATRPVPAQTLSVPAPSAPKMAAGPGTHASGTYYAQVTYVTSLGETLPSIEASYPIPSSGGQGVTISPAQSNPPQGAPYAMGYNVYVSDQPGKETRQNQQPLPLGSVWTMPSTGLLATGGVPPGTNSGPYATTLPQAPGTQYAVASDYSIFQTISGFSDGQLHVGNARCPDYVKNGSDTDATDLCPPRSPAPFAQFYKEYPAQIVLCLDTLDDGTFYEHYIYGATEQTRATLAKLPAAQHRLDVARATVNELASEEIKLDSLTPTEARKARTAMTARKSNARAELQGAEQSLSDLTYTARLSLEKAARTDFRAAPMSAGKTGGSPTAPSGTGGASPATGGAPGGGGGASPGTAGAMGQVTLALQPNRISSIVPSTMCKGDQLVLHQESEEDFDEESQKFTHIEWRSIAEIIQYLGAVTRYQDRHRKDGQVIGWSDGGKAHRLFSYAKGSDGRISVDTRDGPYTVPMDYQNPQDGAVDHSLQTLALLNELISIAKISGSLPVPQPVQVLP